MSTRSRRFSEQRVMSAALGRAAAVDLSRRAASAGGIDLGVSAESPQETLFDALTNEVLPS